MYNQTMTVQRPTHAQGDLGQGTKPTHANVAGHVDLPCRVRQLKATEAPDQGKEMQVSTHRVYCDVTATVTDASIKSDDQLVLGGQRYEVNTVDDPHKLGRFLQIDCTLRQEAG